MIRAFLSTGQKKPTVISEKRSIPPSIQGNGAMKILFTGASSFTGMHFAKELAEQGHKVICPFLRPENAYIGIRRERIELLRGVV